MKEKNKSPWERKIEAQLRIEEERIRSASQKEILDELGDDVLHLQSFRNKIGRHLEALNRDAITEEVQAEEATSRIISDILVTTENNEAGLPPHTTSSYLQGDQSDYAASPTDADVETELSNRSPMQASFTSRRITTFYRVTQGTLLLFDIMVLGMVALLILVGQNLFASVQLDHKIPVYAVLICIPLFSLVYASYGLYNPVSLKPEGEILKYLKANLLVGITLSVPILFLPDGPIRLLWFAVAIPLLMFVGPLFRVLTRIIFSRFSWWGVSAFVIAKGERGKEAIKILNRNPEIGIKPMALIQDDLILDKVSGVPVLPSMMLHHFFAKAHDLPYAILGLDEQDEDEFLENHNLNPIFQHILLARQNGADLLSFIRPGRRNAARLKKNTFPLQEQFKKGLKRLVDVIIAGLSLLLLSPLLLGFTILIKLTIQGSVLNRLELMGKDAKPITVFKFRTRHLEDEETYYKKLNRNPKLRQIYEMLHDFPDNSNMTRLGLFMRRFNLDKLPQLWNVLCGDLGLVGPRPYMPSEVVQMQGNEQEILTCKPGITGLWQVSGRHRLNMDERIALDLHYSKHNTFQMDLYIFLKSLLLVLTQRSFFRRHDHI